RTRTDSFASARTPPPTALRRAAVSSPAAAARPGLPGPVLVQRQLCRRGLAAGAAGSGAGRAVVLVATASTRRGVGLIRLSDLSCVVGALFLVHRKVGAPKHIVQTLGRGAGGKAH